MDTIKMEQVTRLGGRIAEDGMIYISRADYDQLRYKGRSIRDPKIRTWSVGSIHGVCLMFEGLHFIITD